MHIFVSNHHLHKVSPFSELELIYLLFPQTTGGRSDPMKTLVDLMMLKMVMQQRGMFISILAASRIAPAFGERV